MPHKPPAETAEHGQMLIDGSGIELALIGKIDFIIPYDSLVQCPQNEIHISIDLFLLRSSRLLGKGIARGIFIELLQYSCIDFLSPARIASDTHYI